MNSKLLKSEMLLKGVNMKQLADAIDKDVATLYRKINGDSDFYRNEILIITNLLDLSSEKLIEIFFAD